MRLWTRGRRRRDLLLSLVHLKLVVRPDLLLLIRSQTAIGRPSRAAGTSACRSRWPLDLPDEDTARPAVDRIFDLVLFRATEERFAERRRNRHETLDHVGLVVGEGDRALLL